MSVEFTMPGSAQYVDFGAASGVVGLNIKTISLWVYLDDVTTSQILFLIWDGTGTDSDEYIKVYVSLQQVFVLAHFSTTNGSWRTGGILNASQWYHIAVSYDASLATNDPTIYRNGNPQTVIKSIAPSGSYRVGTTVSLYLSSSETSGCLDGKLADVRVYDVALTDEEVAALYEDGPFGYNNDTDLVFNAPLTKCTALSGAAYDGYTLGSSNKLMDRINCVQGTPSGSPLGSDTNPT